MFLCMTGNERMGPWSVPEAIAGQPVRVGRVAVPVASPAVDPAAVLAVSPPVSPPVSPGVVLAANPKVVPVASRVVDLAPSPVVAGPVHRVRDEVVTAQHVHRVRWVRRSPRKSTSANSIRPS